MKICDDLMTAARFMTDDGFSLDAGEATKIGLALAELSGQMRTISTQIEAKDEKEQAWNE